jgi:hypothetical protein
MGIDYENITPSEIFKKFPEYRQEMVDIWVLKIRKNPRATNWIEFIIPSFKCERLISWKELIRLKVWFPFYHQVFWFLLSELKDVKFALSELKLAKDSWYTFPNWNILTLTN